MRGLQVIALLIIGAFFGAMAVFSAMPEADFSNLGLFSDLGRQLRGMSHAFSGVMVGLLWAVFGITIARVVQLVFFALRPHHTGTHTAQSSDSSQH